MIVNDCPVCGVRVCDDKNMGIDSEYAEWVDALKKHLAQSSSCQQEMDRRHANLLRDTVGPDAPSSADQPVQQWCERHWAIMREGVERGEMNGLAMVPLMMEYFLQDERVMRRCGWNPDTGALAEMNPAVLNALTAEVSPVCCFLGDEVMQKVYEEARRLKPQKGGG